MPEVDLDNVDLDTLIQEDPKAQDGDSVGLDDADPGELETGPGEDDDSSELTDQEIAEITGEFSASDEGETEDEDDSELPEGDGDSETTGETGDDPTSKLEERVAAQDKQIQDLLVRQRELLDNLSPKKEEAQELPRAIDPQLQAALRTLWYGGEKATEQWERYPTHVQQQAREFAQWDQARDVAHRLDDERFYQDRIQRYVEATVEKLTKPLVKYQSQGRASQLISKHEDVLQTTEDKLAVAKILDEIPGEGSLEKKLSLAVELFRARRGQAELAKTKEKVTNKERDLRAQKQRRRSRGKTKKTRGRKKTPELENWNLKQLADEFKTRGVSDEDMASLADIIDF